MYCILLQHELFNMFNADCVQAIMLQIYVGTPIAPMHSASVLVFIVVIYMQIFVVVTYMQVVVIVMYVQVVIVVI